MSSLAAVCHLFLQLQLTFLPKNNILEEPKKSLTTSKCTFVCRLWGVYLQVLGDGMCWAVGDHENGIGLADHPVASLYLPSLPVSHSCPHSSHTENSIVWVVQFPVRGRDFIHLSIYLFIQFFTLKTRSVFIRIIGEDMMCHVSRQAARYLCTHMYPSTILRAYSAASLKYCR